MLVYYCESFSAVNMYRIVAVILFSFIYSVQSEVAKGTAIPKCKMNTPILKESRNVMQNCFSSVVDAHLNGSVPGKCGNVSEFGKSMQAYYTKVAQECKLNLTITTDHFVQFVNHSLRNGTFKDFYGGIACVQKMEVNISKCVSDKVGYFNITHEHKHSSWHDKIVLTYDGRNCDTARDVKACTLKVLNSCNNSTRDYVASLFDFSLQNCNNTSKQNKTTRPEKPEPSKMSKPVLATVITISVLIAIIIFVFLFIKLRHRMDCYNVKS